MKHYKLDKIRGLKKAMSDIEKEVIGFRPFVFLLHAKWCDHCKTMKPDWDTAIALNNDKDIIVIEIEGDIFEKMQANYRDHMLTRIIEKQFVGFPHISGVSKSAKLLPFSGERCVKKFTAFMNKKNF
jgi:thiol-disulfide isomerase/thioredoxin